MPSLSRQEWATPSLCPDWDVKGVITHLAAVEHVLQGWQPADGENSLPFDAIGAFTAAAESWSTDLLAEEVTKIFGVRRADLEASSEEMFAERSMTPVGPGTYHRFMDIRTFDFWVHERDITTPLGRETVDGGSAAEVSLDEVHNSIGYIVGKKVGLPDGMSIAFRLAGPIERNVFAAVEGRAAKVDHVDAPSVEVVTDSTTFIQLACGRIDPQGAIDAGKITWSGDQEWGEKAARNLRFTM